jgi:hypothetical protein
VLRSLEKNPEQRWQSVHEFAAALQAQQHGLPSTQWAAITANGVRTSSNTPSTASGGPQVKMSVALDSDAPRGVEQENKGNGGGSTILQWAALGLGALAVAGVGILLLRDSKSVESGSEPKTLQVTHEPSNSDPMPVAVVASDAAQALPQSDAMIPPKTSEEDKGNTQNKDNIAASKPKTQKPKLQKPQKPKTQRPSASGDKPERWTQPTKSTNNFDLTSYYAMARANAKRAFDDAVLIRIDADGVKPNGKADLTLGGNFDVTYRFISPKRAKRPKDLPLGVEHKSTCLFYVNVTADKTNNYPLDGWKCPDPPIRRPRCSAKQVWAKAIAEGAPKSNAIASLGYRYSSGEPSWYFDVKGVFSKRFKDDCQ